MYGIEYYMNFCKMVFYFFKQIIVPERDIYLDINIYSYYDKIYGKNMFPSTVIIFISNIINDHYYNDNRIKVEIIDTIIHELFHTNQKCDLRAYDIDNEYANKIEQDVLYKTSEFILKNKEMIEKSFHVNFDIILQSLENSLLKESNYKTNTNSGFIYQILSSITDGLGEEFIKLIKKEKNVVIVINDEPFEIKNNGRYLNPFKLMSFIDKEALKYNIFNIRYDIKYMDGWTIIIFKIYNQTYTNLIKIEKDDKK